MLSVRVLLFLISCINNGHLQQLNLLQERQCGTVAIEGIQLLIINGTSGQRGEVPWHAGIYTKTTKPYQQICGGSLISSAVIVSAAHCFWNLRKEEQEPADKYAVAVGKLYRPWNEAIEQGQRSDVKEIHLPVFFQGSAANFQDDIAVVIVTKQFIYDTFIKPVCLDFDIRFEERQLQTGHMGKVAGWGLTEANGRESQVLKVIGLPYVDTKTCISESPLTYRGFITSDKLCAGFLNAGKALCKGDSGGGLVFPKSENGPTRYYLRGVVSSAPTSDSACNPNFYTVFTRLQNHQHFINRFLEPQEGNNVNEGNCILPPYPVHGTYVTNKPNAKPGDSFESVTVNVTCRSGYGVEVGANGATSTAYCVNGLWSAHIPKCISQCRLTPHPSVDYRCIVSGAVEGSRACNEYEPSSTVVKPVCRRPYYFSAAPLINMRCIEGNWDYVAKCSAECGTVTPQGELLIAGGVAAKRGEVPWHAGIYSKTKNPYQQICGGSLIAKAVVISVAHCFWNNIDHALPASDYAVAVGKLYRPWDDSHDDAQKSDVKEIHIPQRFQGSHTNFQDDIAIVIVEVPFEYNTFVRPICVDFDYNFGKKDLKPGNMGKVAGWGLDGEEGKSSQLLQVVDLPYVDIDECLTNSSSAFRPHITSDKFCAGYTDGHASLCKGDTGGGLVFPTLDRGIQRYYLRGVVSVGETNEHSCNIHSLTGFTSVLKHEHFIKEYWTSE